MSLSLDLSLSLGRSRRARGTADPSSQIPAIAAGQPGAWYDSTNELTPESWLDRTGNGHDLAATTGGGDAPVVIANALNGRSAAHITWEQYIGDSPIGNSPTALSLIALSASLDEFRENVAVLDDATNSHGGGGSNATLFNLGGTGGGGAESSDQNIIGIDGTDAADATVFVPPTLIEGYIDDAASPMRVYVNGVSVANIYSAGLPRQGFWFDRLRVGVYHDIYLVAAFPVSLDATDRQTLYDWIAVVFGVELPAAA